MTRIANIRGTVSGAVLLASLFPACLPLSSSVRSNAAPGQLSSVPAAPPIATGAEDRAFSVALMTKIAEPVLAAASEGNLKGSIPTRAWEKSRARSSYYEAFARTLAGLAPWLELGPDETPEGRTRARFIEMSRAGLIALTDPESEDRIKLKSSNDQPLVETAYLALAILSAKTQLWDPLTDEQKANVLRVLRTSRAINHNLDNNWVLFPAMVETALLEFDSEPNMKRIDSAIERVDGWYVGDGAYGDGRTFRWDYYNSLVIHPFYLRILESADEHGRPVGERLRRERERAWRYACVLERMISPEGTIPIIGRSEVYRFGVFYHLSNMALRDQLPKQLNPGAVRAGMTTVIRRMTEHPETFDADGWLRPGVVGAQHSLIDPYNSTGSLYICLMAFVDLGLPPDDRFWTAPAADWTQRKVWSGGPAPKDVPLKR